MLAGVGPVLPQRFVDEAVPASLVIAGDDCGLLDRFIGDNAILARSLFGVARLGRSCSVVGSYVRFYAGGHDHDDRMGEIGFQ